MKKLLFLSLVYYATHINAVVITSPVDVMKQSYPADSRIEKRDITLTDTEANKISLNAKVQLDDKIIRTFKASKNGKTIGFGILINRKVRSKNAVVLYVISADSILKSIEIVAFNEPMEYIPLKNWMSQFENLKTDKMLRVGKEIPTITGATMSARSIVDGSRIAFALYNEMLKGR